MSRPELIEKIPISLTELKQELEIIQKRDEELSFRSGKSLEYANSFVTLSKTAHNDLKKKIEKLEIPRFKEDHVCKVIDLLPQSVAELDVILQGYTLTVSKENKAKIIKTVKDFLPKKSKKNKE